MCPWWTGAGRLEDPTVPDIGLPAPQPPDLYVTVGKLFKGWVGDTVDIVWKNSPKAGTDTPGRRSSRTRLQILLAGPSVPT